MHGSWTAPDGPSRTTVKRRFVQGTLYSTGSMVFSTVALLVAGKLLTNALSPEAVGHFALLLLCGEFLGMLANLGLPATLPKLLQARAAADRESLLACLFSFQLAVALAVAAVCTAAAIAGPSWLPYVETWLPLPAELLALLPVIAVAAALRDFLLAGTAGRHAYGQRAGALALISALQVTFFAALYVKGTQAPLPFAGSYLLAVAGGAVWLARSTPGPQKVDWAPAMTQVRFSLPLFVNNLLNFVYQRVDTLLVVYFLGIGTAAVFEMAKRIPGVLSRFFAAALIPYLPSVAELLRQGDRERASRLLQRASRYTAFAGYTMTLLAVAVQEPLLQLLFTGDYTHAAPVLGPLLIAACLAVQAGLMGQALIALDRPRPIMYINVGLAAISLALNLVLVPQFGLAGAGWSAAAATLFSYGMQRWIVSRSGIVLPIGRGLLVHLLFIAAYAVPLNRGSAPLPVLAAAVVYVVGCLILRVVPLAELRLLFRRAAS